MNGNIAVKYPEVKVQLVGLDGNAFSILGRCREMARRAGISKENIENFTNEAQAGDYDIVILFFN